MSRKKTNKIEAETGEVVQSNRPFIIRNGGIAKPLGHGLYLLGGKTHEQGGIDIDFTGDARIFSAQPILNGNSPAELVARGANPNITFNRQERFKDVNRINDDGSRKAKYGIKANTPMKFQRSTEENPVYAETENPLWRSTENLSRDFVNKAINEINNGAKAIIDKEGKVKYLKGEVDVPVDHRIVTEDNLKSIRKGLDYIGGDNTQSRLNYFKKVPALVNMVDSLSNVYGINKDIMLHRLSKEGLIDNKISEYNYYLDEKGQRNTNEDILKYVPSGFYELGLDRAGEHLAEGHYNLRWKDKNLGYYDSTGFNEKGSAVGTIHVPNMASGLEIKAAHIEYLTNLMKKKYPNSSKKELDALINAAYNLGENHEDLNEREWINKNYEVLPWSEMINKSMNNSNKKQLGGSTGLIRVQANGKDRLMYVPFTGEETKASRKKAQYGEEVIITAPNKKREEFLPIASSIDYPDSLSIVSPYVRTPYSIRTKTPADLERDMKVQMIGREFSNDTTSNYLDKVRFNEAYVPYDGEMANIADAHVPHNGENIQIKNLKTIIPNSIENPIERINRRWQSEYKPIEANNTIKEVNGVVNTSWLPKRNNISVNIPKINTYDPRIAMIGRTFSDNTTINKSTVNDKLIIPKISSYDPRISMIGRSFADDKKVSQPNKVNIPKFNTPTITGVSSSSSDLPSEITLNQNVQNVIDRNIATDGYNEFMGHNKYNVPEVTDKQVRQQTKAALKKEGLDWASRNKNWAAPAISALGNIGAGIASYAINKRMLGDLNYSPTPVAKRAVKLKTNININPELTALNENLSRTIEATNANTASSRVANARNQAAMLNTTLTASKLYTDKENRETSLINQDRLNQQEVANANIDAYNTWRTGKTNFANTIREQLSENAVSLADNINKGIQTTITDAEKRRQFRNNLAVMAAAYPNVTPELLRTYGVDFLRMGGKVKLNKKK